MTDQEIIKALRCCASIASCYKCPFQTEMICRATLKSAAANLGAQRRRQDRACAGRIYGQAGHPRMDDSGHGERCKGGRMC